MRSRFPRPGVQLAGAAALSLAMFLVTSTAATGQDSSTDPSPLARYVPKDNLVVYVEFDGLDAHADAWRKTAAYKILNETTTGAMLEDVFAQVLGKLPARADHPTRPADDVAALLKHLARSGFLLAQVENPNDPRKSPTILVIRNAFKDKAIRPVVGRFLQGLAAPNAKQQPVVRAGHKVITGSTAQGRGFTWWVEDSKKEDVVLVLQKPEEVDVILETLDGKRPSAVDHPRRAELMKPENGFIPNGLAFVDPRAFRTGKLWEDLGLTNLAALDLRWGFQDDALMMSSRIATTGPRKGVLALFDGPTFEKAQLPPIPESVSGFTVESFDLKATLEKLVALAKGFKPDAEDQLNRFLDSIKGTSKLRLKEDILAHVGPKVAWYVLPSKALTAAPAGSNMFSRMMAGAGMEQVPRLAIVFDIEDPIAFGRVLDEAMAAANREFKAQAAKAAGEAARAAREAAKGTREAAKGARNRGSSPPILEFRIKEDPKTYFLSVPPELSGQYPASFRPAIQVGPKHAVLAVSIDVAKAALELKGAWTPPNSLGVAFQGLSTKLKVLNVSDPSDTLPAVLASFPAKLQSAINTAILMRSNGAVPPPDGPPPGQRPGEPGRPGAPGTPGANPAPDAPPTLVFQVDAAKLPSADSIRKFLFPSVFTVEVDGEEIKITSRDAFPPFGDPSKASLSAMIPSLMGGGASSPPGVVPPGSPPSPDGGPPGRGPRNRPGNGPPTAGRPTP